MENSSTGERNPTLVPFFLQTMSIYIRWPFQSPRHTIFAHLLNPLSSARRCTALYSPWCRERGGHGDVTGSDRDVHDESTSVTLIGNTEEVR